MPCQHFVGPTHPSLQSLTRLDPCAARRAAVATFYPCAARKGRRHHPLRRFAPCARPSEPPPRAHDQARLGQERDAAVAGALSQHRNSASARRPSRGHRAHPQLAFASPLAAPPPRWSFSSSSSTDPSLFANTHLLLLRWFD